jgi:hypothetical protein
MLQIISKEAIDKSKFDVENAKAYGEVVGLAFAGFIAAHVTAKVVKKTDSLLVNGSILAGGFVGAMCLKNPMLKIACIGAAMYGGTRCLAIGVQEVVAPGATAGLAGFIPESVKAKLREFIPTLGSMDDLLGLGNADDEMGAAWNLDDAVGNTEDINYTEISSKQGVGSTATLLM